MWGERAVFLQERRPSLAALVGHPLDLAQAVLPSATYITTYSATGRLNLAVGLAAGCYLVVAVLRRAKHVATWPPLAAGVVPLALGITLALRTGEATNAFLPGIAGSILFVLAAALSMVFRRPLAGVLWSLASRRNVSEWRESRSALTTFQLITAIFAGASALRAAVQGLYYVQGDFVALGVSRLAMGVPLYALCGAVSWALWRRHRSREHAAPAGGR